MRLSKPILGMSAVVALLGGSLAFAPQLNAAEKEPSILEQGKEIAFDRKKGNCLACHKVDDGASPGNIGPPLISMKVRFPEKEKLRAQIYDATQANPNTMMPPFGKHGALSAEEIDKVVEYIYTL